jgi:serine phosphatase RsbU (regulator of sigma subunit)
LGERGPGDFFGEMSLLIPDGVRTATIRARTPGKVLALGRAAFEELLERRPTLANKMVRTLSLNMRESDDVLIRDLERKNRELRQAYEQLQAAQAQIVENRVLEHELNLARDIQKSILPGELRQSRDFNFGARILPARSVGGDLYDLMEIDEVTTGVAIGDVSGKGIPAAIFMAHFSSLLRAEVLHSNSPLGILQRVNNHLLALSGNRMFVTAIFGVLDHKQHEFVFARAGHEIPILVNQDGKVDPIKWGPGQLLGFFNPPQLDEQTLSLPPGSTLLLFTDGVIDARNPKGEQFGRDRLVQITAAYHDDSAQNLCDRVVEALFSHMRTETQFDDITLLAIKSLCRH